jgi:hypothetical protein
MGPDVDGRNRIREQQRIIGSLIKLFSANIHLPVRSGQFSSGVDSGLRVD